MEDNITNYAFQRFESGDASDRGNAVRDAMELIRASLLAGGQMNFEVRMEKLSDYADQIEKALKGSSSQD